MNRTGLPAHHLRMMLSGDLANHISDILGEPVGTVLDRAKALRRNGLVNIHGRGPRSGARMTAADSVNVLLVNAIDHGRGVCVAGNVRRVRALPAKAPPVAVPVTFANALKCFAADNFGDALDALLDDLRTGRLAAWAAGNEWDLRVTVESRGRCGFISLAQPKRHDLDLRAVVQDFAETGRDPLPPLVTRQITLHGTVFTRLATALGPPPPS